MNSGGCLIVVRDDGRCERRWWSLGGNRSAWWQSMVVVVRWSFAGYQDVLR
ncbi:hypothetical protein HanRHA438_Chr14g0646881 [Helianthus annuus]|nr:hypothetical protein HanRHA438_Chr14g0646881 [Helianthus annuus]